MVAVGERLVSVERRELYVVPVGGRLMVRVGPDLTSEMSDLCRQPVDGVQGT